MKKIYKIFTLAITGMVTISTFFANTITTNATQYWPTDASVNGDYAIVMEEETGTILYALNADEVNYPASITKVMTAMLTLENCDNLDDIVTFSHDAVYVLEKGSSSISRDEGEKMTVEQTLYGLMLESANECAWALGEYIAGDVDTFVDMMNQRAKELGCTNTHFCNPSGLPDKEHYTTCHDMALIAQAAYRIPKFQEIVGTKTYSIPPTNKHPNDITYLNNHHNMLHFYRTNKYLYEYCLGGKTGYTDDAKSTLVTYAKKDGMTLVCVVMHADKNEWIYLDTIALFDYCFDNFAVTKIADEVSISDTDLNVTGTLSDNIDLIKIDENATVVLPKTAGLSDATSKVVGYSDPNNPSVVGRIIYSYAGKDVGYADLIFDKANRGEIYPFDNLPVSEGGKGIEYITIDTKRILIGSVILIAVVVLIIFINSKLKDIFKLRHRAKANKRRVRTNFTKIRQNYSRKRRRRR